MSGGIDFMTPVLQFLPTPYAVKRSEYRNASSPANPQGSLIAEYALRSLVDPIPLMTRAYQAGASLDHTWGLIIDNADAPREQGLVLQVISDGREAYSSAALSDASIAPGQWWPVEAIPANWMAEETMGFREVKVDLSTWTVTGLEGEFQQLPGPDLQEQVRQADGKIVTQPLSASTAQHSLTLRVLQVEIRRAWLPLNLLATAGWHIDGEPEGYVSSGQISEDNQGILPLIPTGFLVGVDASLDPLPNRDDTQDLVAVGPFALSEKTKAMVDAPPPLYLIGMVSQAVRRMPTVAG